MSSLTHIFGELDRPKIECAADEPCIWIRARHDTVSLTLNREQRQKLRAALDECDEMEKPVVPVVPAGGAIFGFYPPTPDQGVVVAFGSVVTADEDARRLRTLHDNLRGFP